MDFPAAVTNSGTIHVGGPGGTGTLAIVGNFTQSSTGILNMEIAGLTAGTQFDRQTITGSSLIQKVLQQASSKTLPDVLMLDNPDRKRRVLSTRY